MAETEIGWLFTGINGERNLARSLIFHYEVNPDDHPALVTEFGLVLHDELMSVTRHFLEEHGFQVTAPEPEPQPGGLSNG